MTSWGGNEKQSTLKDKEWSTKGEEWKAKSKAWSMNGERWKVKGEAWSMKREAWKVKGEYKGWKGEEWKRQDNAAKEGKETKKEDVMMKKRKFPTTINERSERSERGEREKEDNKKESYPRFNLPVWTWLKNTQIIGDNVIHLKCWGTFCPLSLRFVCATVLKKKVRIRWDSVSEREREKGQCFLARMDDKTLENEKWSKCCTKRKEEERK